MCWSGITMLEQKIDITFFVGGERYASRGWYVVPRVGDEVMLGPHKEKKPFVVRRVVFGVEAENEIHRQSVNIELRKLPTRKGKRGG